MQLALDQTSNDLILKAGAGVERVSEGRFIVQLVRSKLQTQLGEWLLDPTKGWLNFDDYTRQPDLFDIENRARKIILGTDGVKEITAMELDLTQRVLTLTFSAETTYGVIDLTVPWTA